MTRLSRSHRTMRWTAAAGAALLLGACASMGRPGGGDYDVDPPVYVRSNPAIGARNVTTNRINVWFNENVQVEDVMNKVVVSPAQKNIPQVLANGHRVGVEIRDTLLPNTTYTIDFSDAVRDLNESNILDGFAIDFSTGPDLDSLRISGMVLEAATLEPAQGILVGVYSAMTDTTLTTTPLERIGRTNQLGQFVIRGLRDTLYHIFAINDLNRDYHWDRSENVAFYDTVIRPYSETHTVTDTIRLPDGRDSVVIHSHTDFFPNDILLTWFNENYTPQYLKDYSHDTRETFTIRFAAPADSLPPLTLLNGPRPDMDASEWTVVNRNAGNDSLIYYITDPEVRASDTLVIALTYERVNADNQLETGTDTLRLNYKGLREEKRKAEQKEKEIAKRRKKAEKTGENIDSILEAEASKVEHLTFSVAGSTQDIYLPARFNVSQPLLSLDPDMVSLLRQVNDSLWDTVMVAPPLVRDSLNLLSYAIDMKWEPGTHYRLLADSLAMQGVFGLHNGPVSVDFTTRKTEDYSALFFNITGLHAPAVVELLDKGDKAVAASPVVDSQAEFPYVMPGTYYARLFIDRNGNGLWDTGSITDSLRQPEDVYYYPKKIVLKANWDVEQSWDINDTPVDLQKPKEIVKNKPKAPKRRRNKDGTYVDEKGNPIEEDDEDDGFDDGTNFFGPSTGSGQRNVGSQFRTNY